MVFLLLLAGCLPRPPAPNCDTRIPFYPDADGDGLGERTDLYLGCHPPAGWVAVLAPATGDTAAKTATATTAATGDTAATAATGDTAATATTGDTADTGG